MRDLFLIVVLGFAGIKGLDGILPLGNLRSIR
jgi:hypothetical protein